MEKKSAILPDIDVYYQQEECDQCSLLKAISLNSSQQAQFIVDTTSRIKFVVQNGNDIICSVPFKWLDEQGSYSLSTNLKGNQTCQFENVRPGPYGLAPLIVVILVHLFIAAGWMLMRKIIFKTKSLKSTTFSKRIRSLDAFRGITIILMIFVNNGGGGYKYFEHKSWFGFNVADCIFPFFILIMGISLSISLNLAVNKAEKSLGQLWISILNRSIKLFIIGLCLNSNRSNWNTLRIPGVLQRFALSYFFVATFRLLTISLQNLSNKNLELPVNWMQKFYDYLVFVPEILMYIISSSVYVYFTFFWSYSSYCPNGYQGPGGLHINSTYFNCTGGAANELDRIILGANHLYRKSTAISVYHNQKAHDPEGLLGTSTSILLTGLGSCIGILLMQTRSTSSRITLWVVISLLLGAATQLLTAVNLVPITKNLWSLSFVTATGFVGLLTLLTCYILIDVKNIWSGLPFIYPGSNSILLYVGSSIFSPYLPFYVSVERTNHYYLLARDLTAVHLWLIISYILAKGKIFIKV